MDIKFKNKESEDYFKNNFNLMLFPYEKREEIRRSKKFSSTNSLWNEKGFNSQKNIGVICNLVRDFHKSSEKHLREEWEEFYFNSENGRNICDINKIAGKFHEECLKENIQITEEEAFNYCYIRIIDESYIGYKREYLTMKNLREIYPHIKFDFTSSNDDIHLSIDIAIFKDNVMAGALQIKSENALKKYDVRKQNDKGFEKCRKKYNFSPIYLISDENGNMTSDEWVKADNYIQEIFK